MNTDFAKRSTVWVWLPTDLKSACIFTLKYTFKEIVYLKTRCTVTVCLIGLTLGLGGCYAEVMYVDRDNISDVTRNGAFLTLSWLA